MHQWATVSEQRSQHVPRPCCTTQPLEITMMNRIRTAIESKRAANQMQAVYFWRPAPPRH